MVKKNRKYRSVTEADVAKWKKMYREGCSCTEIAEKADRCVATVYITLRGELKLRSRGKSIKMGKEKSSKKKAAVKKAAPKKAAPKKVAPKKAVAKEPVTCSILDCA